MIDTFSILLSHGLVFLACWRLLARPDLDRETPATVQPATPSPAKEAARPDA